MGNQTKYHIQLSDYFASKPLYLDEPTQKKPNTRKLVEQPWQQTMGEMWDEVTDTLCNLDFIQAKAASRMTYELVNDFNNVFLVFPDNQENTRLDSKRQVRLDKYAGDLVLYSKGEIQELEVPESITPWSEDRIDAEIERIRTKPNRLDNIYSFSFFVGIEANNLQNYSWNNSSFAIQQALNTADDGPVVKSAIEKLKNIRGTVLLSHQEDRPAWKPLPLIIRKLEGLTANFSSVVMSVNGRYALSGSSNTTAFVWDLKSGKLLKEIKTQLNRVSKVAITADGNKAFMTDGENKCILWDIIGGETILHLHEVGKDSSDINSEVKTSESLEKLIEESHVLIATNKGIWTNYGTIKAIDFTPDDRIAITGGSYDGILKVWDLSNGKTIKLLEGFSSVHSCVITPKGDLAFTGSYDSTCRLWDLNSGELLNLLVGHSGCVEAVAITPDGRNGISGSTDRTCIAWDFKKGTAKKLEGHHRKVKAVAITPDGRIAISGSEDNSCILWDLSKGIAIKRLEGHYKGVSAVAISPDGKFALSGSDDGTSIIWNIENGIVTRRNEGEELHISSLVVSPNGKFAITGELLGESKYWDLTDRKPIKQINGSDSLVESVDISQDGKYALANSWCDFILRDLSSGQIVQKFQSSEPKVQEFDEQNKTFARKKGLPDFNGHSGTVSSIVFTPDGRAALSGSGDSTCILWDLVCGKVIKRLEGHTDWVHAVDVTPDGKMGFSGSDDNTCILWNLESGKAVFKLRGHTDRIWTIAIAANGKSALSGSFDKTCILWDLKSGRQLKKLEGHTGMIHSVLFLHDGKHALSGSDDKTCILWDLEKGQQIARFCEQLNAQSHIRNYSNGFVATVGNYVGMIYFHTFGKILLSPPVITLCHRWNYHSHKYLDPIVVCPKCDYEFDPPASVLATIDKITNVAVLRPEQSPCLELPDDVWEEPGLLSNCPNCGERLKFNPFIVLDHEEAERNRIELEKQKYAEILENAENAFNEADWDIAFKLYLSLIQTEKFDVSYLRFKMALCRINSLDFYKPEIIANVEVLKRLLQDAGENERVQQINDKLIERLESIKKAEKPWWKKMF